MHQLSKITVKKSYEKAAISYDEYRAPWTEGPLIHLETRTLSRLVKDGSILEVGIGTGRIAKYFNNNHEYFGIDITYSMVNEAKRKYGHELNLVLSDAEIMCFRENSFDNIIAAKVFKFLNPLIFLKESKRVLKNNGRLFVLVQVKDSFWFRLAACVLPYIKKSERRYYTWELSKMLKEAGFKFQAIIPVANIVAGFYLFIWYLFYPCRPLRKLLSMLNSNPLFIKLIASLDRAAPLRFLVLLLACA